MSYILDALKKAERDRLRDDPQRLDDFTSAAWDPYQPIRTKKSASKVIVVLVIIATCLLFAFYGTGGFRLFHSQDKTLDRLITKLKYLRIFYPQLHSLDPVSYTHLRAHET